MRLERCIVKQHSLGACLAPGVKQYAEDAGADGVRKPQKSTREAMRRELRAVLVRPPRIVHPHAAAKAAKGSKGDGALEKALVRCPPEQSA